MPAALQVARRHRTGWTPLQLSGLVAWYDFSTLVLPDGTAIASLADLSGHGYTMSQGTGSKQPITKVGIQHGLTVGRFNSAASQVLDSTATITQPITVFAVANPTSSGVNGSIVGGGTTSPSDAAMYKSAADQINVYGGGSVPLVATVVGTFHVFEAVIAGASSLIGSDGLTATGNASTTHDMASGLQLGANGGANFFLGDIGEAIFVAGSLDATYRKVARQALGYKWEITVA